ncbi:hypothetical protein [Anthocerotibacter panamensis]|uniref:hypothetical protein n=1 Tax=Anthocerotibacter panamensis TaxID=2857077 RepID=UPI001C40522D|nr:hypothetical protein [Anthocerotibacter panamensis]
MDQSYQVGQIVQVCTEDGRLWAEVRSVSTNPKGEVLCWARPLVITPLHDAPPRDVRLAMDVIWPIHWFIPAYDTELLAIWAFLDWEQVHYLGPNRDQIDDLYHFSQGLYRQAYSPTRS